MNIKELLEKKKYKPMLLFFGLPRTGKTAFLSQIGEKGTLIDFDNGLVTVLTMKDEWTETRSKINVESFTSEGPDDNKAYNRFLMYITSLYATVQKSPEKTPKIIGFDSFTGLMNLLTDYILGNSGHAGKPPTQPEYGLIFAEARRLLRLLNGIPAIKILTGHLGFKVTGDITYSQLLCTGVNFPNEVCGFFDDILYTKKKKLAQGKEAYILTTTGLPDAVLGTRRRFTEEWDMNKGLISLLKELGYEEYL